MRIVYVRINVCLIGGWGACGFRRIQIRSNVRVTTADGGKCRFGETRTYVRVFCGLTKGHGKRSEINQDYTRNRLRRCRTFVMPARRDCGGGGRTHAGRFFRR